MRTALALITAGLAVTQLLPPLELPGGRRLIGLPLIGLGVLIAAVSYRQWERNERAMRLREPLPPSPIAWIVVVVVGLVALVAFVLALVSVPS
jgi:putative membrane protein